MHGKGENVGGWWGERGRLTQQMRKSIKQIGSETNKKKERFVSKKEKKKGSREDKDRKTLLKY